MGISKLRNLNDIRIYGHLGLHKKWLLTSKHDHHKLCDFMQKINFSMQDMNNEIHYLENPSRRSIIYVIILAVWIQEAFQQIVNLYRDDVLDGFVYKNEEELEKAKKYINALRSFAVAHPLTTNRHKPFGFDGNYICVDIRTAERDITFEFTDKEWILKLDHDGIHDNDHQKSDFYMYVYSEKDDGMMYFRYIGCDLSDIYRVAELYIDKLYAMDKYLSKLKKADFEVNHDQT